MEQVSRFFSGLPTQNGNVSRLEKGFVQQTETSRYLVIMLLSSIPLYQRPVGLLQLRNSGEVLLVNGNQQNYEQDEKNEKGEQAVSFFT